MRRSFHVLATVVSATVLLAACGGGGGGKESDDGNAGSGGDSFAGAPADPIASDANRAPDATQWDIREVLQDVGLPSDPFSVGLEDAKIFGTYHSESGNEAQTLNFILGKQGLMRGTPGEYMHEEILDMNKMGHLLLSASYRIDPNGHVSSETDASVLFKDGQYVAAPTGSSFLNDAGQIAGTAVHIGQAGPFQASQAFLYIDGVQAPIPLLPGTNWNRASALNNDGHVVGYARTSMGEENPEMHRAYVYRNGKVEDLGNLPGTENCVAEGIDSRGVIIGRCHDTDLGYEGSDQPFIYRDGAMQRLPGVGRLGEGKFAINGAGRIIGAARSNDGEGFPFVHSGGKTVDLNELPGVAGTGVSLHEALYINRSSQILAAHHDNGKRRYFLLTPSAETMTAH